MSLIIVLAVIGGIALIALMIIMGLVQAKRHREAMEALAARTGWQLRRKDRNLPGRFDAFGPFGRGSNRYADWIIEGMIDDMPFQVFHYHYETHTTDSKGRRQTNHHHHRVAAVHTPISAPELRIVKETVFHKVGDALGGEDIDFESDQFSRNFWVKCKDRKFAYDIVTPSMMEFLMPHKSWSWEWRGHILMLYQGGSLKADRVEGMVDLIHGFHQRLPRHVIEGST